MLRPLADTDLPDVLAYRSRPDVYRYLENEPMDAAQVATFIQERRDGPDGPEDPVRLARAIDLDGVVIGDVVLRSGPVEHRQAEIGWVLHPAHQGHGYAAEAARELADWAFGELGIHRVWAQLDPRNEASARLCERLGMRREAHLHEESWFKGDWGDLVIYAVLESEWR